MTSGFRQLICCGVKLATKRGLHRLDGCDPSPSVYDCDFTDVKVDTKRGMITIKKGLDLPIAGGPDQTISSGPVTSTVALVGDDYVRMKPTMAVREGDSVKLGQVLFTDKRTPGVQFTSPGCGEVVSVVRGAKRKFESVVIDLKGDEEEQFTAYDAGTVTGDQVRENLVASGLWTALRTRPYNRVPEPDSSPHSIFVTTMDTNPLAADPVAIIGENAEDFIFGLLALTQLTEGRVFVCHKAGDDIPGKDVAGVSMEGFAGPHPAGLPGTHIHFLDPVSENKTVWFVGYQDVIAFGALVSTGRIKVDRVISLAGPGVANPRLIRTRIGARIDDLVAGELREGDHRVISGSVLSGRTATEPHNFLGRYHLQISAIEEGHRRELFGWAMPGLNKFSVTRSFASFWLVNKRRFGLTTSTGGSKRAMVPIGLYEKVVPLDVLPTYLLRALIVDDVEQAVALGCLELDEDDLGLCTFVCPGKYDYGPILRRNLTEIEIEG